VKQKEWRSGAEGVEKWSRGSEAEWSRRSEEVEDRTCWKPQQPWIV